MKRDKPLYKLGWGNCRRSLAWCYGPYFALYIADGLHAESNADLEAWKNLGGQDDAAHYKHR